VTDSHSTVLIKRSGRVSTLTLNRPDRLNAVGRPLYEELIRELEAAAADPGVRCIVLTGSGRAFCAGADLKAHAAGAPEPEERELYIDAAQRANELIQTIGTPVVAAVNGHAIGAGLEMALSADFMIVADKAKLRLPEVALATFVGGGAVYTLAERVGVLRARELIYFGEFFSGTEAARMGIANLAVPVTEVLTTAMTWAGRLAKLAPLSIAAAKRMIGPAGGRTRTEAMSDERAALSEIFGSADWAEGVGAFHDGRDPEYRGE
jgi:enoyl-CoA hydratase